MFVRLLRSRIAAAALVFPLAVAVTGSFATSDARSAIECAASMPILLLLFDYQVTFVLVVIIATFLVIEGFGWRDGHRALRWRPLPIGPRGARP